MLIQSYKAKCKISFSIVVESFSVFFLPLSCLFIHYISKNSLKNTDDICLCRRNKYIVGIRFERQNQQNIIKM